jgi:serine/threonine protein kinase
MTALAPGILLDRRYRVIQILAKGGFGQTYVAEDTRRPGNPRCVVKHLKPASNDSGFLQNARRLFSTEAETLERLGTHDQIPRLLAYFEEEEEFFLVQDLIEGHTLTHELKPHQSWTEAQILHMLQDVLNILMFVHSQGVIHRDVKPDNLIRRWHDGKLVLVDFGTVKQIRTQQFLPGHASVTIAVGTPGYMPTEQHHGKPRHNSDLYALGIIGIQASTGLTPSQFQEDPETGEIIWRPWCRLRDDLAAVLTKMVRYHFRERYLSAGEVLEALDDLLNRYPDLTEQYRLIPVEPMSEDQAGQPFSETQSAFVSLSAVDALGESVSEDHLAQNSASTSVVMPSSQLAAMVSATSVNTVAAIAIPTSTEFSKTLAETNSLAQPPDEVGSAVVVQGSPDMSDTEATSMRSPNSIIPTVALPNPIVRLPGKTLIAAKAQALMSHLCLTSRKALVGVGVAVTVLAVGIPNLDTILSPLEQTLNPPQKLGPAMLADIVLPTAMPLLMPCQERLLQAPPKEPPDYTYADGITYYGELADGYPADGRGIMVFPNGLHYDGEFRDGKRSGCGILAFATGKTYKGEFQNDQINGLGIWIFENGDRYVGELKDNQCHGKGTFIFANGRSPKTGIWQNDHFDGDEDLSCNG